MEFAPITGLMSAVPEQRGAALLELLSSTAGLRLGVLTALDAAGRPVVVAALDTTGPRSPISVRRLTSRDGRGVGALRFATAPEAHADLAALSTLMPHCAAVAEVVTRRNRLGLTNRERDILRAIADGHTNAEIAHRECVSVRTVTTHVEAIFRKLGVTNRVQAARVAIECAMVHRSGLAPAQGRAAS